MFIHSAGPEDCSGIARVQVESNRTTYRGIMPDDYLDGLSVEDKTSSWMKRLFGEKNDQTALVAMVDKVIVGFICGSTVQTDPDYQREIHALYILEQFQGRGIGRELMTQQVTHYLSQDIQSMMLWTLYDNKSKHFYEKLGGVLIKERTIDRGGKDLRSIAYGWRNIIKIRGDSRC